MYNRGSIVRLFLPCTLRIRSRVIVSISIVAAAVSTVSAQEFLSPADGTRPNTNEAVSTTSKNNSPAIEPMEIGPIPGLTTTWHRAPSNDALIPRGTILLVRQPTTNGSRVVWQGAEEIERTPTHSLAHCTMDQLDSYSVTCTVIPTAGEPKVQACVFQTTDYPTDSILVLPGVPTGRPFTITEDSSTEDALDAYFDSTVSTLHTKGDGNFVAATGTPVKLNTFVFPAGFAPLIEWQIDDTPAFIGANATHQFRTPGPYTLKAASPDPIVRPHEFTFEIYHAIITSFDVPGVRKYNSHDFPTDTPVTFYAQTNPPGYEQYIQWIAATKFGETFPVIGSGPSFTVEFIDPYGIDNSGNAWLWAGVRADNASRGQDQKAPEINAVSCPFPERCIPNEDSCVYTITQVNPIPGASAACPNRANVGNTMCIAPCPPPVRGNCPFGVIVILDVDDDGTPDCRIAANQGNAACAACPSGSLRVLSNDPAW